jgi:dTDP-L-rhamnose 4-epimerase
LLDVVLALGAAFQRPPVYSVSGQFRIGDIRHAVADTAKLFEVLGKYSFTPFREGISRFGGWVMKQDIEAGANSRYIKSLDEMAGLGILRGAKAHVEPSAKAQNKIAGHSPNSA